MNSVTLGRHLNYTPIRVKYNYNIVFAIAIHPNPPAYRSRRKRIINLKAGEGEPLFSANANNADHTDFKDGKKIRLYPPHLLDPRSNTSFFPHPAALKPAHSWQNSIHKLQLSSYTTCKMTPQATLDLQPRRFPITVEMYHLMAERGVFGPDDRVELIEGEIFDMSPIGSLHARCVKFLNQFLTLRLNGDFLVGIQDPIILNDNTEPQPDISVLKPRKDFYKDETPRAGDTLLIIEVADSTADFDRNWKFQKYASSGITEAWLVDLTSEIVEIHTQPRITGYSLIKIYRRGEIAVSATVPAIHLSVDDILG